MSFKYDGLESRMMMLVTVNIIIGFSFLLVYPSYLADFRFEGSLFWSAVLIVASSAWSFGVFISMTDKRYRVLIRRVSLYRLIMIGVPFILTYAGMVLFAVFISKYLFAAALISLILAISLNELILNRRKVKSVVVKFLKIFRN